MAINIKDYGAIGDGLANDTDSIVQAIESAGTRREEKYIFLPVYINHPVLI